MDKGLIILAIIALLLSWQLSQASSITTSVINGGSSFLSTAVSRADASYSNSLFTEGISSVFRGVNTQNGILSDLRIQSGGSFGIDEYGDVTDKGALGGKLTCVFLPMNTSYRNSQVSAMGMFQNGGYLSQKKIQEGLFSWITANATGMIITSAGSVQENQSEYARTVASGNMSVVEEVDFTRGTEYGTI